MASDPNDFNHSASRDKSGGGPQEITDLTSKAERCRRLAAGISDSRAADVLRSMATDYEQSAARLSQGD